MINKIHEIRKMIKEELDKMIINKYLVIQEFQYEGKNTWTVFASSPDEAKDFVVKDYPYFKGERHNLTYEVLKSNIRGTKFKGIHKRGSVDEMN